MGPHPPPDDRSSAYGQNRDQHPGSNIRSVINMRGHTRSPQHDARSQQAGPQPPAVHHHHEGDRRSQCGVIGWEPVVSRVGEQGLDRRIHDKGAGVCIDGSLLAPDHYDEGHVVLIADDENQITSGRTPFYQWLAAKNTQLTPGMRVIVNTRHSNWPDHYRGYGSGHPRLHPPRAETPRSTTVHTIAKRTGGGDLSFTYPRTVKEWIGSGRDQEYRVPTTPASCTLTTDDQFVLPIDLVTVAEMRDYLAARTERHAYEEMFPTLTAAIAFKEAEAAEEAPFRALLAAQIAAAHSITLDEAAVFVDELVSWWKVGNRWNRALNGEPDAEVKAARMILAEHAARVRATDGSDQASQTLQALRAAHPKALFIARKKDGTWVVGTPCPRRWAAPVDEATNRYRTQAAPLDVFIDLAEYTPTGKARTVKTWQVPEPAAVSRWTMLHTTPQWETLSLIHISEPTR